MKKLYLLFLGILLLGSVSAATYIEPFDFKTIFIDYFLGNGLLFPFAFVILISLVCGYFGMPNKIFTIIITIESVMFGAYIGEAIYFLVLFVIGWLIFYSMSKIFTH